MSNRVIIFDTTLRDGEQSPGATMNLQEKLRMARQLESLGVDVIEAGFPASSVGDFEAVHAIANAVTDVQVAALARCNKNDIDRAWQALNGARNPRIHVFLATSPIHMEYKLKMTREQVIDRIREMVAYAKSYCDDIEFSAEDASRSDWAFLAHCYSTAVAAGATTLNVPDTVGYSTPQEMYDLITYLRENIEGVEHVDISVHCHNDLGMAVANSLECVRAGATQVECTVNGIGERAGNASLEEIVMALRTRKDFYDAETGVNTKQIYRSSKLLSNITGVPIPPSKAIVGANAEGPFINAARKGAQAEEHDPGDERGDEGYEHVQHRPLRSVAAADVGCGGDSQIHFLLPSFSSFLPALKVSTRGRRPGQT